MYSLNDIVQAAADAREDEAELTQSKRVTAMSDAELQKWMLQEANRLIDARSKITRPASPVWTNQIVNSQAAKTDPERDQINATAAQVAARLAQRDGADEKARW